MIPEVRRTFDGKVIVKMGSTLYAIKDYTSDLCIQREVSAIDIFHTRRYVDRPYKVPLRRLKA